MKLARAVMFVLLFLFLAVAAGGAPARAEVESNLLATLDLEKEPLAVVSDARAASLYVLTPGEVLIYSTADKSLQGRIPVDPGVDGLAVAPRGDLLFLTNGKTRKLSVVSVDFVYAINVEGSPFKGPAGAPVTVAVFSDYQ